MALSPLLTAIATSSFPITAVTKPKSYESRKQKAEVNRQLQARLRALSGGLELHPQAITETVPYLQFFGAGSSSGGVATASRCPGGGTSGGGGTTVLEDAGEDIDEF